MALVERTTLVPETAEYEKVARVFNSRSRFRGTKLELLSIEKVQNLVLQERFKMKKQQYEQDYGHVRIVQGWHGTKESNVASILKKNFDVSMRVRGRFGAGVSFSKLSSYAADYSDKTCTAYMILSDVLVSNIKEVPENKDQLNPLIEPLYYLPGSSTLRYDTTARSKKKMNVFVKSEQDTYLPTHVVHFKRDFKRVPVARPAATVSESSSNLPTARSEKEMNAFVKFEQDTYPPTHVVHFKRVPVARPAAAVSESSSNLPTARSEKQMNAFVKFEQDTYPPTHVVHFKRVPVARPAAAVSESSSKLPDPDTNASTNSHASNNRVVAETSQDGLLGLFLTILHTLEIVFYWLLYAVQRLKVKVRAANNLPDVECGCSVGGLAALLYPSRVQIGV